MADKKFQNPEGWGCDSHMTVDEASRGQIEEELFQNPEGWGCDSHAAITNALQGLAP